MDGVPPTELTEALPERAIRAFPAVISTEAEAMAWARAGATEGSLVVAQHQLAARARPMRPWVADGADDTVSFSLVLRPVIQPIRGGWLYLVGTLGIADVLAPGAVIAWPDEVVLDRRVCAHVGVHLESSVRGLEWSLLNAMVAVSGPLSAARLAHLVEAIEARYRMPPDDLVEAWRRRSLIVGCEVRITLYPVGAGRQVAGQVSGVRSNGALMVDNAAGRTQIVRPQDVSAIEVAQGPQRH